MKKTQKFKRSMLWTVMFGLLFFVVSVATTRAGVNESGRGWLWGGSTDSAGNPSGINWISMNNLNPEIVPPGSASYGVSIPLSEGDLSGYAWDPNIGWVGFSSSDLANCPIGPCVAHRTADNKITGWARILSIRDAGVNAGGWLGWIRLTGPNYGVVVNPDNSMAGYAWSDEMGWIRFDRAFIDVAKTFKVCRNSCSNGSPVNNESMLIGDSRTYKACYDTSSGCTGGIDVTSSTTWSDTNIPNAVNVSGGVVTAIAEGTEAVKAAYDPGTGPVSSTFNVSVSAVPPVVTCGGAIAGGPYDSAPTANLCSDSALHPTVASSGSVWTWTCGSSSCSAARNATNSTTWREVAP